MQIAIKSLATTFALNVNPTDTIESVKKKIFKKTKIPVDSQRLMTPNGELENKTVEECELKNGSTVCLFTKFDPAGQIRFDSTILMSGDRGSFKTQATISMIKTMGLEDGIVICESPEWIKTWTKFQPEAFVWDQIYEDKLNALLNDQAKIAIRVDKEVEKLNEKLFKEGLDAHAARWESIQTDLQVASEQDGWSDEHLNEVYTHLAAEEKQRVEANTAERFRLVKEFKDTLSRKHAIYIVFDDLGFDKALKQSKAVKRLAQNGRHYLACCFFLCQQVLQFPSGLRSSIDWIAAANTEGSRHNLTRIHNDMMGIFREFASFVSTFDEIAPDFGYFLVVQRRCTKYEKGVFSLRVSYQDRFDGVISGETLKKVSKLLYDQKKAEALDSIKEYETDGVTTTPAKKKSSSKKKKEMPVFQLQPDNNDEVEEEEKEKPRKRSKSRDPSMSVRDLIQKNDSNNAVHQKLSKQRTIASVGAA